MISHEIHDYCSGCFIGMNIENIELV